MVNTALILFAVAAVAGFVLFLKLVGNKFIPIWLVVLHGLFAASGLVILAYSVLFAATAPMAKLPLALFVIAAVGGFTLLSFHLRNKKIPLPLALAHGLLAALGFVILLYRYL